MPFPSQVGQLNNYTYPSLQSLAFPALFPFSASDATDCNCMSKALLTHSNKKLLKYCACNGNNFACLFAKHNW